MQPEFCSREKLLQGTTEWETYIKLLTMFVNYSIINIIVFPWEYELIQCIHDIPTVLQV